MMVNSLDGPEARRDFGLALPLSRRDFFAASGLVALGACAPRTMGLTGVSPGAFEWTLRPPAAGGMSQAGIEGIRAAIQGQIDAGTINGAVSAVVRHNQLVWYEAQGLRDPNAAAPMRRDDIFRMMSSTKPVTAVAVLLMVQEGRLSLDDRVSRFIPTFANPRVVVAPPGATDASQVRIVPADREIVVRDLLTHTSGITSVGDRLSPSPAALVNHIQRLPDDTLATWAPKLGGAVLDFNPGTKFAYSPTDALDVALRIVEIVSGQPADRFLEERLFEPCDMRDTGFNVPPEKQSRIVDIHAREAGSWVVRDHLLGPGPYRYFSGGGGLFSTVHDFINFELMLLNRGNFNGRRILRPEMVDLMSRNQVGRLFAQWIPPLSEGHGFGLAVRVVEDPAHANGRSVGAFGWGGAYGTESWAEPGRDMVAAFFLQMQSPAFTPSQEFERAVQRAIAS